jgi:DNA-binding transcriptional ArsR family regulator
MKVPNMGIKPTRITSVAAKRPSRATAGSLANALFSATQQRLLELLFGQPQRSFFVTELIELAGVGRGAVQRELVRLERSGLVVTQRLGKQKHYRANPDVPIYRELCGLVRKTSGAPAQRWSR